MKAAQWLFLFRFLWLAQVEIFNESKVLQDEQIGGCVVDLRRHIVHSRYRWRHLLAFWFNNIKLCARMCGLLVCLPVCISICLSVRLSVYLPACMHACLIAACLSVCLVVCLPACMPVAITKHVLTVDFGKLLHMKATRPPSEEPH